MIHERIFRGVRWKVQGATYFRYVPLFLCCLSCMCLHTSTMTSRQKMITPPTFLCAYAMTTMNTNKPAYRVSEGSLHNFQVGQSLASKPGSQPGFYNEKRRVGRDFVVLSVARSILKRQEQQEARQRKYEEQKQEQQQVSVLNGNRSEQSSSSPTTTSSLSILPQNPDILLSPPTLLPPLRVLDAMCATGMQGLRVAIESPYLAQAAAAAAVAVEKEESSSTKGDDTNRTRLQLVLNDMDHDTAIIAEENVREQMSLFDGSKNADDANFDSSSVSSFPPSSSEVSVRRRVAQSLLHEEHFDACILDPFGSVVPYLDAAFARAPHLGTLEICSTDVNALYGSRPQITKRHYNTAFLSAERPRPPSYRERGVRLLLAACAQAANRQDRGIEPILSVSTEHFVVLSVRVLRGAKNADKSADQIQPVRLCRTCGKAIGDTNNDSSSGSNGHGTCPSTCGCEPMQGSGTNAIEEGPLWVGHLYDADEVKELHRIANIENARDTNGRNSGRNKSSSWISKQTCNLLSTLKEEASLMNDSTSSANVMFYQRPTPPPGRNPPKLVDVISELETRGYKAVRTHFDKRALRTNAPIHEFDLAVQTACSRGMDAK